MSSTPGEAEERQPRDEETTRRMYMGNMSRSMSIETTEGFPPIHGEHHHESSPPMLPFSRQSVHSHRYHQGYVELQARPMSHHLHPAITTSFSTEERDGSHTMTKSRPMQPVYEQRYDHDEKIVDDDERRDDWHQNPRFARHVQPPPPPYGSINRSNMSPPLSHPNPRSMQPQTVERAYSTPGYISRPDSLKRNFYHHSRPSECYGRELPSDFLPPKRTKLNSSTQKETVVTPRSTHRADGGQGEWYARNGSFDPEDGHGYNYVSRASSYPVPPTWTAPHRNPPRPAFNRFAEKYDEAPMLSEMESSRRHYHAPRPWSPGHSPRSAWSSSEVGASLDTPWSPPRSHFAYKEYERMDRLSYEASRKDDFRSRGKDPSATATDEFHVEKLSDSKASFRTLVLPTGDPCLLLALSQDRIALSETLCVVREVSLKTSELCPVVLVSNSHSLYLLLSRISKYLLQNKATWMLRLLVGNMRLWSAKLVYDAFTAVTQRSAAIVLSAPSAIHLLSSAFIVLLLT
jgi:hypothetical protein